MTTGIPVNWHDDGHTLTAPNGFKVVGVLRSFVLAHSWDTNNYPLENERTTPQLEDSNPGLGGGTQQIFRFCMLADLATKGVIVEWIGQELLYARGQVAKYYPAYQALPGLQAQVQQATAELATEKASVASLSTQLQQSNAQIAAEQATIATLQAELAGKPDLSALANRLSAINMEAKQASDLLAEVQQQAAQPIS